MRFWPKKKKPEEKKPVKEIVVTPTPAPKPTSRKDFIDHMHVRLSQRRPICDVCNKPVEGMTEVPTVEHGTFKYIVDCHGDTEDFVLTKAMVDGGEVTSGRAFVGKTREMAGRDKLKLIDLLPQHQKDLGVPLLGVEDRALSKDTSLVKAKAFKTIRIKYEEVRCQVVFVAEPYAMTGADKVRNRGLRELLVNPLVICYIHPYPGDEGNIHIVMRIPTQSVVTFAAIQQGAKGDSMWGEAVWNQIIVVKDTFTFYDPRKLLLKWIAKGLVGEESNGMV